MVNYSTSCQYIFSKFRCKFGISVMEINGAVNYQAFDYSCTSLYDCIADGKFRYITSTRDQWRALASGAYLQSHCNRRGFNTYCSYIGSLKLRIGIFGNNENDCHSCDSWIGVGKLTGSNSWKGGSSSKEATMSYVLVK